MISKNIQKQIIEIWEDYQKTNKKVLDTKGVITFNIWKHPFYMFKVDS